MSLPVYYPFKTRVLNATSSSSSGTSAVAVAARSKLLNVWYAYNASQTGAGAVDLTVNGSTIAGAGGIATTTTTAGTSVQLYSVGSNSAASINSTGGIQFLNAGDVLGTSASSQAVGTVTFVVQEF